MTDKILYKVSYSGVSNENWIEDRETLEEKRHPERSTFLSISDLKKSGRDLQADLRQNGMESAPRKFIELNDIVY